MAEINLAGHEDVICVNAHGERLTISLPMELGRFARLLRALASAGAEFLEVTERTPAT